MRHREAVALHVAHDAAGGGVAIFEKQDENGLREQKHTRPDVGAFLAEELPELVAQLQEKHKINSLRLPRPAPLERQISSERGKTPPGFVRAALPQKRRCCF